MQNAVSDYQKAASIYCEQEDWENYQEVLNTIQKIQKIQTSSPEIKNQKYQVLCQRLLGLVGGHWEIARTLH